MKYKDNFPFREKLAKIRAQMSPFFAAGGAGGRRVEGPNRLAKQGFLPPIHLSEFFLNLAKLGGYQGCKRDSAFGRATHHKNK